MHGWQDYNVKQSEGVDLYEALPLPTTASASAPFKRLYLFQGSHQSPSGRPHFDALLDEFFATTLRGAAPGPELAAPVLTQGRTAAAPGEFRDGAVLAAGRGQRRSGSRSAAALGGRDARRLAAAARPRRSPTPAPRPRRSRCARSDAEHGLARLPRRAARGRHADRRHAAAASCSS